MTANYAIWWFLKPSQLLLYVFLFGLVLLLRGRLRGARITLIGAAAGFVVLGLLPVGSCLLAPLENRFPEPDLPPEITGVIVLAGAEQPAQSLHHRFPHVNAHAERLLTGLALAQRYPTARLVHSGRTPIYENETASDVARDLLLGAGLEPSRLLLEDRSTTTCESARELARMLSPQPDETWLMVTSAFHMPRAVACFRAVDWTVLGVPVDYLSSGSLLPFSSSIAGNLGQLDLAAHEWLGLIVYRLSGRTSELFPAP